MSSAKLMVQMMGRWTHIVFRDFTRKLTPKVRAIRLLEEVIELCQAEDMSREEIAIVLDQAGCGRALWRGRLWRSHHRCLDDAGWS